MTTTKRQQASNYKTGAFYLAFLFACSVFWMIRTSEPKNVVDDMRVGKNHKGIFVETTSHFESQRDSTDTTIGWMAILGFGGATFWCWIKAKELTDQADSEEIKP